MKRGYLSQYFEDIAVKKLSLVEADTQKSNQHEFHGTQPLRKLFGKERLNEYPLSFVWLGGENEAITEGGFVTWYDAREKQKHRSAEWRLYFKSNQITDLAQENDLLIVTKRPNKEIYIIIIQADSTFENQMLWLFDIQEVDIRFNYKPIVNGHDPKIDFAARYILEELGIEIHDPDAVFLDSIIEPYILRGFPSTKEFSALARETISESDPTGQPDLSLVNWMEHEEKLFKRLERYIVQDKLKDGFTNNSKTDVDGFIKFSLSVHNRRKSRVGYALENHLQEIFKANGIAHSRGKITEHKSKPDFLFPDIYYYKNHDFPTNMLTMLGVKSTCKDRWRQVLAEAERIETKHLFTLEPGISENQTEQMQVNKLQLVLPKPLHKTFTTVQEKWLMDLGEFINLVGKRQQTK